MIAFIAVVILQVLFQLMLKDIGFDLNFPCFFVELMVEDALDEKSFAVYSGLMDGRLGNHQEHFLLVVFHHYFGDFLEVGNLLEEEIDV